MNADNKAATPMKMKTEGFFIHRMSQDKMARINYQNNKLDTVSVPELSKITSEGGFCYTETQDGRFFISGGIYSLGTLHEAIRWDSDNMRLEQRQTMNNARSAHCMTAFSG